MSPTSYQTALSRENIIIPDCKTNCLVCQQSLFFAGEKKLSEKSPKIILASFIPTGIKGSAKAILFLHNRLIHFIFIFVMSYQFYYQATEIAGF